MTDCGLGWCNPSSLQCVQPCAAAQRPDTCSEDGLAVVSHVLEANGTTAEGCMPAETTKPCEWGWCDPANTRCAPLAASLAVAAQDLRVSFRPWSGPWRIGQMNKAAIRSAAVGGRMAPIAGEIVADDAEVVARFRTSFQGEGSAEFVPVPGKSYRIVVKEPVEADLAETKLFIP